jgi:hypothetical protein
MIRDLQSQIEELKRKLQSNEGGAFSAVTLRVRGGVKYVKWTAPLRARYCGDLYVSKG